MPDIKSIQGADFKGVWIKNIKSTGHYWYIKLQSHPPQKTPNSTTSYMTWQVLMPYNCMCNPPCVLCWCELRWSSMWKTWRCSLLFGRCTRSAHCDSPCVDAGPRKTWSCNHIFNTYTVVISIHFSTEKNKWHYTKNSKKITLTRVEWIEYFIIYFKYLF